MKKTKPKKKKEFGIYARCSSCGQPIWDHMEKNKKYFDEFDMCGVCVTGESKEYIDEL